MTKGLSLYQPFGELKIVNSLKEFVDCIPITIIKENSISIPKKSEPILASSFDLVNSLNSNLNYSYTRENHELNKFIKFYTEDYNSLVSPDNFGFYKLVEHQKEEAVRTFKHEELLQMILKKPFKFFLKDLNQENISNLSRELAMFGVTSTQYGIKIDLSASQKLFTIIDPNDFMMYVKFYEPVRLHSKAYECETAIRGKLINLKDNNLFTFRYFDDNLLKELYSTNLYRYEPIE